MSVPFPAPDGPETMMTRERAATGAAAPAARARCRSERPPIVFPCDMRQVFRNRVALTFPYFGTAISMSNTLAVITKSGGLAMTVRIDVRPLFRSFLSCALRERIWFARRRASIR